MRKSRRTGVRLTLTMLAIFAVVLVFTGRLVDLGVVQAPKLTKAATKSREASVVTYGTRGSIVDTNGVVLADSVDRFDITVSPKNFPKDGYDTKAGDRKTFVSADDALGKIARLTGTKVADLRAVIDKDPKSDFAYLVKGVTLAVFTAVTKLNVPGVYSEPDPSRSYPNGAIAGNLVGFVGTDGAQAGVELAYNKCLASTNGTSTYEKAADGTRIPGSTVKQTDPVNGGTVKLTIDRDLQYEVQQAIADQAKTLGAPWATGVVERVSDGHLMAVADYPTVDPNDVSAAKRSALGSLAFSTPYEPGSTFKAMSAAALIDAGAITPTTKITVPAVYTHGLPKGSFIKDSFYHGTLHYTTAGVLENSSNIGISILSQSLNKQARHDYMVKFGIGQKTAVDFGAEQSAGYLAPASQWDPITNRTVEFGQGVSATSVQVAQIFETLANHGVREPSTLVEGCTKADGTVVDKPTAKPVRVVSTRAANEVDSMLETVVSGGPIGPKLKIPGYRIAAKTGTAQVASTNGTGYTNKYIISVAGMAPAEDPQYVVVVTFGPTTLATSAGAAPAFKKVMTEVLQKYRVPPSTKPAPFVQTTW
jgi:cell division protein FtsI (penicillin-binding protein 3)